MLSEEKFYERAEKFTLVKNTEGKYFTLEEYADHIKALQEDKDKKLVWIYTSDLRAQHGFISKAKERGYDVLVMDGPLDNHFVNLLEQKRENTRFTRVDADTVDKLIARDEEIPAKLSKEEEEKLRPWIEESVDKDKFQVVFEYLSEDELPMLITRPEFLRRMRDMSALGGMSFYGDLPESLNLVVNGNHPLIGALLKEEEEAGRKEKISQLTDLALLSQHLLEGEALTAFIRRSVEMVEKSH
jgi:molecular chaperone HtpG